MTRLGQHFLRSTSVLKNIVDALELEPNDFIVEIGPGHGELTNALIAKKIKIRAIERDPELVIALQKRFAANHEGIEIVEGDALKFIQEIAAKKSTPEYWKLVGNIPYYITGKLLRTISEIDRKPERSVLMVQREVAERMCAEPPHMNRLAASVQFSTDAKIIARVPKEDFSPAPEVDSAIVLLKTKPAQGGIEPEKYYRVMRAIFSQPRKTLLNNLTDGLKSAKKSEFDQILGKIGIDSNIRPQNLTVKDIESIATHILWG